MMKSNLAYHEEPWDEMIDGKIVMMSPRPTVNHSFISANIYRIFWNYLKGKSCTVFSDGVDLYLTEKDRFIPDCMIVCDKNKIKLDGVHGAPDLVVEVLSPSTAKFDRGHKKNQYAKAGVKEYWLVDPNSLSIEVYLPEHGRLEFYDFYAILPKYELSKMSDAEKAQIVTKIHTSIFPELEIELENVFDGIIK